LRPNLILNAEKELGIVAGLQDRVAQVYGGLVYMVRDTSIPYWQLSADLERTLLFIVSFCFLQDFSKEHMDKLGHGIYRPLDINLLPPLYLIYAENPSDSGKVVTELNQ
jgi:glucuronokinase